MSFSLGAPRLANSLFSITSLANAEIILNKKIKATASYRLSQAIKKQLKGAALTSPRTGLIHIQGHAFHKA